MDSKLVIHDSGGEWRQRMEQSVERIQTGLEVLISLYSSQFRNGTGLEVSTCEEVFAEHIVGNNVDDLDLLLGILSPKNLCADDVWAYCGLKVNGRSRGFRTCILINFEICGVNNFSIEIPHVQQALVYIQLSSSAHGTAIGYTTVNPVTATNVNKVFNVQSIQQFPISQQKLSNYQKEYIRSANAEIERLQVRVFELEEAVEILHDNAMENSELARKWKLYQSQPRNTKRKASETGNFVHTKQREEAAKRVISALDTVADTPLKRQLIGERVMQHCALSVPTNVSAKCMIAECILFVVNTIRNVEARGNMDTHLKALRDTIIRTAVPTIEDLNMGSSATVLQNEIGHLLGINYKNREYRNAVKWRKVLNSAVRNNANDEVIAMCLLPVKRKVRSDALNSAQIDLIEQGWRECSEQSPNAKDTIRSRQLDGSYTVHAQYACYSRIEDVVAHLKNVHNVEHSVTTVHNHKPYYIRNGTIDTCLCHYCENIRLMKVAVLQNAKRINAPLLFVRAFNVIKHFVRTWRFVRFLRRLPDFEPVRSRILFWFGWFIVSRFCRFHSRFPILTIVDACRGAFKSEILDRVLCKGALPVWTQNCPSDCGVRACCGECDASARCKECIGGHFKQMLSKDTLFSNEGSLPTAHLLELLHITPPDISANTIKYKTWGTADSGTGSGELVVVEGTVAEFADYVELRLIEYAYHTATLRRQKNASRQLEINLLPNMIEGSVDFSENMTLNVARGETQSAHWRTDGATLFICVLRYLCLSTWHSTICSLDAGAAVTVDTEKGCVPAVVVSAHKELSEVTEVQVRLLEGNPTRTTVLVSRTFVHLRKLITTPIIVVSNDKHHDTYFVQHFLNTHMFGPRGWLAQQSEEFRQQHDHFHWSSDGAASHFKQVNTIVATHRLRQKYNIRRLTWTFGGPGHGKGVWDGLGGTVKHTSTRHMLKTNMTIKTAEEFYNLVVELFDSEEARHKYGCRKEIQCSKWNIYYTDAADTDLLRPTNTDANDVKLDKIVAFPHSIGTRRIFYYEPLGVSHVVDTAVYRQVAMRINACYCSACIAATSRTGVTQLQYRRPRQPLLPTENPKIEGCILGEGWDYQQVRERQVPRVASTANTGDAVAAELPATPTDQSLENTQRTCWAQCDICGKWRTTKCLVEETDSYVCGDTNVTQFQQYANCHAELEVGAEET